MTMQDPKDKLELKENVDSGVYVKDLTTFVVKSAMEIDHVMQVSTINGLVAFYTRPMRTFLEKRIRREPHR